MPILKSFREQFSANPSVLCRAALLGALFSLACPTAGAVGNGMDGGYGYRPDELLVKFKTGKAAAGKAVLGHYKAAVARKFVRTGIEHWQLPEGASMEGTLQALRASGAVAFAEPNYRRYRRATNDTYFNQLWALKNTGQAINDPYGVVIGTNGAHMSLEQAWLMQSDATGVVLAVIDDSIDIHHPDLSNNIWSNLAELNGTPGNDDDGNGYVDDLHGWDFANNDNDPSADNVYEGHGTAVAGCAGATSGNGLGITGVAPGVQIMPLKFAMDVATELAAVDYAIAHGATIVNISWGGPQFSVAESYAMDALADAGVLVVAAAGNSTINNDLISDYPSGLPHSNIIAVGASTIDDGVSSWTQFGQTTVDLVAPGEHIFTTMAPISSARFGHSGKGGLQYDYTQGSSFSAPYVAGITALLKANLPPTTTAEELRGRLLAGVKPLTEKGVTATDGRADALGALNAAGRPVILVAGVQVLDGGAGNGRLDPGESVDLEVTLENAWMAAANVTATLSSTDPLVRIAAPTADYGSMAALSGARVAARFGIALDTSATGHRRIPFQLDIVADGNPVTRHLTLETGTLTFGEVSWEVLQRDPRDRMQLFHLQVPTGANVRFSVNAGSDVDLAVRAGAVPEYHPCYRQGYRECAGADTRVSAGRGGNESVRIGGAQGGTYYLLVTNYSGKANVNYTILGDFDSGGGSGAVSPMALLPLLLILIMRGKRLFIAVAFAGALFSAACEHHPVDESRYETWLVTFAPEMDRDAARRLLEDEGVEIVREYAMQTTYQVTAPEGEVRERLRRLPGVVAVEPNLPRSIP